MPARVGGVVDGMGRQEPPMRGRLALRGIDLTRLDEVQLEAFRQPLAALAVLGPADDDRAEAQGNHRLAGFSAGNGGQLNRHPPGLGPSGGGGEQAGAVRHKAVLARPNQLLDSGGPEGETLIDIAFAVLDHGHASRAGLAKPSGALSPSSQRRLSLSSKFRSLCGARSASRRSRQIRSTRPRVNPLTASTAMQRMRRQTKASARPRGRRSCPESQARAGRKPAHRSAPPPSPRFPGPSPADCAKSG